MIKSDFIEAYLEATKKTTSPTLFRKWSAIAAVAGALERKVWVHTAGSNLYPNMYVILVAPPGVGKTEVTWRVRKLWTSLEDHFVARTSVTKASLIDELAEANRRIITHEVGNPVEHFNSLLLCINELGVLLPSYENEFMNTLTDLWDCKHYSERRRTSKLELDIDKPQLNLLAACTPSYLMHVLPEGAWDQGFLSRTMLIYSGDRQLQSLFTSANKEEAKEQERQWEILQERLNAIGNLYGEIRFTAEAAERIDYFHMTDGEPKPDEPRLMSYNIRRTVHLLKLCMVSSVARSDQLVIELEDYHRAMEWLLEAESHMPDIFKAMAQGGTGKVIEETWHFIFKLHAKEQNPVQQHRIIQFLQERVPVHNIEPTLQMMEKAKLIEKRLTSTGAAYLPRGKAK